MTKRLKIILSATAVFVVLTSGTIFGLAKTGVINIRMLADEIGIKSARTLTVSTLNSAGASANQTIKIYRKSQSTTTLGTLYNQKSISNSPGSADFSIESGYYYDAECVGSNVSPSLNIDATSGTSSLTSIVTCTANNNGGGGGTCTNNSNCNTNNGEWCNAQGQCSTTCTVGAQGQCPAGYSCNNGSCTNSNNNTCNANNCSAANGWTCQNNVCSNACTGSGQSTCPANFSCSNNQCTRNQVFTLTGKIQATSNGTTINLADTEVKLQANGKDPVSVRTDTNGNYTITNYPMASSNQTSGNSYTLTLTRAGYTTKSGTLTSFNLASLPTINTTYTVNTTMQASSTATVYGKVVKEDGSPVEGVTVKISVNPSSDAQFNTSSTVSPQLTKPAGISTETNYILNNIPLPSVGTSNRTYYIQFLNAPSGYIHDIDNDGVDDGPSPIQITNQDLLKNCDFIFKKVTATWIGKISINNSPNLFGEAKITITPQLSNGDGNYSDQASYTTNSTPASSRESNIGIDINYQINNVLPSATRYKFEISPVSTNFYVPSDKQILYLYDSFDIQLRNASQKLYYVFDQSIFSGNGTLYVNVQDSANNLAISDAEVEVSDPVCSFEEKRTTNQDGSALFAGDSKYNKYYSGGYSDCFLPTLKVAKNGYITHFQDFDNNLNNIVVNLIPISSSNDTVFVKVVDYESRSEIPNAKIKIWKGLNSSGEPTQTGSTNSSGYYSFNNSGIGNNLVVSAYKDNYFQTTQSTRVIKQINTMGKIDLILYLNQARNLVGAPIFVMQKGSMQPLPSADVYITSDSKNYHLKTTGEGVSEFYFEIGKTYSVVASVGNTRASSNISFPQNYWSLSSGDQELITNQLLFVLDLGETGTNLYGNINLRLLDSETNSPIANAIVSMSILGENVNVFSNNDGKISFLSDFLASSNNYRQFLQNKYLQNMAGIDPSLDLQIGINAPGYNAENLSVSDLFANRCRLGASCDVEFKLSKINNDEKYLILQVNDALDNMFAIDNILSTATFEKYNSSKKVWEPFTVSAPDKKIKSNEISIKIATYGKYRARISNPDLTSGVITINKNSAHDNIIQLNICSASSSQKSVDYPDNISLLFPEEQDYEQYLQNPALYDNMARKLSSLKHQTIDVGKLSVVFTSSTELNADAYEKQSFCASQTPGYVMRIHRGLLNFSENNSTEQYLFDVLTHEYGHLVLFSISDKDFIERWHSLFDDIKNSSNAAAIYNSIIDANVTMSSRFSGGHPQDNADEFFASFYIAYFNYHSRLHGIIKYHQADGSENQNILAYVWNILCNRIGSVYGNDNSTFPAIGGSVGDASYTFDQIKSGLWRSEIYNKLSLEAKVAVQYQRLVVPKINKSLNKITDAVNKFNTAIRALLLKSNLLSSSGQAKITIKNSKNEVLTNTMIEIGPLLAISNSRGVVNISNLPAGDLSLSNIISLDNKKYYNTISAPSSRTITIQNGKTTNLTVVVSDGE